MVQGENTVAATGRADEGEEIDRIMKEIEDLEKKMDGDPSQAEAAAPAAAPTPVAQAAPPPAPAPVAPSPELSAGTDPNRGALASSDEDPHPLAPPAAKVLPMRPQAQSNSVSHDSLAETDAVPARDEPLMRSDSSPGDGGLALKIGGCTEVNLEFTRSDISVSLSCTDEALVISTNQGAEFRIPFKRAA